MTSEPMMIRTNDPDSTLHLTRKGRLVAAEHAGFELTNRGGECYRKGELHVWMVENAPSEYADARGICWQTAFLIDGRLRQHEPHGDFLAALKRKSLPTSVPLQASAAERDRWIEAHAAYFTAVRGLARNRVREEFRSRIEAERWARMRYAADGRTMIYAVASNGESAHLGNV